MHFISFSKRTKKNAHRSFKMATCCNIYSFQFSDLHNKSGITSLGEMSDQTLNQIIFSSEPSFEVLFILFLLQHTDLGVLQRRMRLSNHNSKHGKCST